MNVTENGASGYNNYNLAMGEHMFDKVLTHSDVGKLNRLVIPKQHAENYFPLEENQNGTELKFEDRNGKEWRFRYLYWSSSQSYVITKGWIRFVKDKKLVDGDTVSFHRGYVPDNTEPDKRRQIFFIDWRHKADRNLVHDINPLFMSPTYPPAGYYYHHHPLSEYSMPHYRRCPTFYQEREFLEYGGYGERYYPLDHHHHYQCNLGRSEPLVSPTTMLPPSTPSQPQGTVKKVRLFGFDVEESSSSGEARGEMGGAAGYSPSSPFVIRDDDEENKRKGKRKSL